MAKTEVSDEVMKRLRMHCVEKHGQVYGHLTPKIDEAITQYLDRESKSCPGSL